MSGTFRFAPELFECKSDTLQLLSDNDFVWMIDFNCIDVVHDLYGLEVSGISNEDTAEKILHLLREKYHWAPDVVDDINTRWEHGRTFEERSGWVAELNKYPHEVGESWDCP